MGVYPKIIVADDREQCSCCQSKKKSIIYELKIPNGCENFTTTVTLCRKCLRILLKGGIKVYNETKKN